MPGAIPTNYRVCQVFGLHCRRKLNSVFFKWTNLISFNFRSVRTFPSRQCTSPEAFVNINVFIGTDSLLLVILIHKELVSTIRGDTEIAMLTLMNSNSFLFYLKV
ncbi:hypothetical protein CEXT_20281 [Caerostris extrusa]|uniref:Uncharacterized protein n=1 Tax=Caerostris extrusa TaxID=172846 RepID=A0AAV4TCM0_CAEEX|nr:hypothetical protein CEXT_20281 [Caerostris extrusa]